MDGGAADTVPSDTLTLADWDCATAPAFAIKKRPFFFSVSLKKEVEFFIIRWTNNGEEEGGVWSTGGHEASKDRGMNRSITDTCPLKVQGRSICPVHYDPDRLAIASSSLSGMPWKATREFTPFHIRNISILFQSNLLSFGLFSLSPSICSFIIHTHIYICVCAQFALHSQPQSLFLPFCLVFSLEYSFVPQIFSPKHKDDWCIRWRKCFSRSSQEENGGVCSGKGLGSISQPQKPAFGSGTFIFLINFCFILLWVTVWLISDENFSLSHPEKEGKRSYNRIYSIIAVLFFHYLFDFHYLTKRIQLIISLFSINSSGTKLRVGLFVSSISS